MNYLPTIQAIYGLPKKHENNILLRLVIFNINNAPENIAKYITKILTRLLGTNNTSHLKPWSDLLKKNTKKKETLFLKLK